MAPAARAALGRPRGRTGLAGAGLALLLLLPAPPAPAAEPDTSWAVTVYGGAATDGGIEEVPGIRSRFTDAYLLAVAPSRELGRIGDWAAFEAEGQVAHYVRHQTHTEFNALMVLRWLPFPWDDRLDTSFAVGEGLSHATSVPVIETERSPNATSRTLNYLMFEWEFRNPASGPWSLVLRLHHRSGIYGLFHDVHRGSNALATGLKYRF